jgi:hypothetical protein
VAHVGASKRTSVIYALQGKRRGGWGEDRGAPHLDRLVVDERLNGVVAGRIV